MLRLVRWQVALLALCCTSVAHGACFGTDPLVFYDPLDGDMKVVQLAGVYSSDFTIKPYDRCGHGRNFARGVGGGKGAEAFSSVL